MINNLLLTCPESIATAEALQGFVNFLYLPVVTIWSLITIPKLLNYIFRGLW